MAATRARGIEVLCDRLFSGDPEAADAFREIRASLTSGDISQAAQTCDRMLALHPDNKLFRGLKLDIENREREGRLESLRRINAELEKITDLDARLNVIRHALNRYPTESQLVHLLSNEEARKDLYQTLVLEARNQELSESYEDAVTHWYLIRELYPGLPGVEDEVRRVEALDDSQKRIKRRAEFVEAIFRLSNAGEYSQALRQCINALAEYPDDGGLLTLKHGIEEKVSHVSDLHKLTSEGMTHLQNNDVDAALDCFVKARAMDRDNLQIRYLIGIALLDKARLAMESDRQRINALLDEARGFIADHPDLQPAQEDGAAIPEGISGRSSESDTATSVMEPAKPAAAAPASSDSSVQPPMPMFSGVVQRTGFSPVRKHVLGLRIALIILMFVGFFSFYWYSMHPRPVEISSGAASVMVEIKATPEEAEIFVDSRSVGKSPVQMQLSGGTHTVSASLTGYDTKTFPVEIGSEPKALQVELRPTLLNVHIVSDQPGGVAWMDEESLGEVTEEGLTIPNVEPGVRVVKVPTLSGDTEIRFEFLPGRPPAPRSLPSRQVAYVLFAGSAEGKSYVECNCVPAGLRIGELTELIRRGGLEIPLAEGRHSAELWVGSNQRSFSIFGGDSPVATIAVFSRTSHAGTAGPTDLN